MFFKWRDRTGAEPTEVFTFSDRNGQGSDPAVSAPSLSHNAMMAHSIRGRVDADNEGPRYSVACHLTTDGLAAYGTEYAAFVSALQSGDFEALDQPPLGFSLLAQHFGRNTGNAMNSPTDPIGGLVLDSWLDADGASHGLATSLIGP